MQCTAGWDFIPSTQDRNVGIFNTVEVEWIVGVVRIKDAYVNILNVSDAGGEASAALPLGDDRHVSAWLELSVSAEVLGYGDEVIKGTFSYWITPSTNTSKILLRDIVKDVVFQSSAQEVPLGIVLLRDVKLWWPHTHSERQFQPLYRLYVQFRSEDGVAVHQTQAEFGVRTVSSYVHPRTKSFALKVNGHPIFLVGGNWVTTDQFLRFAGSKTRYLHELLLLRNAGFNCVRVWGGGISETDHFFESADSLGLLVYQEFWLTGDNNGRWAGRYDWPEDHGAMLENARDVIVRLRNHPSLAWYGGGNELYPLPSDDNRSEVSPPFTIEKELRSFLRCLDGSRPYITSSVTEIGDLFDSDRSLAPKDGPYGVLPVRSFYDRNPGTIQHTRLLAPTLLHVRASGLSSPLLTDEEKERSFLPHVKNPDAPGRNIGFQAEVSSCIAPPYFARTCVCLTLALPSSYLTRLGVYRIQNLIASQSTFLKMRCRLIPTAARRMSMGARSTKSGHSTSICRSPIKPALIIYVNYYTRRSFRPIQRHLEWIIFKTTRRLHKLPNFCNTRHWPRDTPTECGIGIQLSSFGRRPRLRQLSEAPSTILFLRRTVAIGVGGTALEEEVTSEFFSIREIGRSMSSMIFLSR